MLTEEEKKAHMDKILNNCRFGDGLYGLPVGYHTLSLVYNKEMIKNPPKTTEEMINIGRKFTSEEKSEYGLIYDKSNYYYHFPWVGGFGGKVIDENKNPTFDTIPQIKAAKFVKSLQEGDTMIMPEEIDYNTTMTLFRKKKSPMMINGSWIISQLKNSGIDYGVARIPMVSETNIWPAPPIGAEVLMMSSKVKNAKETLKFIQYLTSHKAQLVFADYGFLPSRESVYKSEELKKSPYYDKLIEYRSHIEISELMPTVPEMNVAIWGEGISALGAIFYEDTDAEIILKEAQRNAQERINEWRVNPY